MQSENRKDASFIQCPGGRFPMCDSVLTGIQGDGDSWHAQQVRGQRRAHGVRVEDIMAQVSALVDSADDQIKVLTQRPAQTT